MGLDIFEQEVCTFKSYSVACFYCKMYLFQHTSRCLGVLRYVTYKNICEPHPPVTSTTRPVPSLTGDMRYITRVEFRWGRWLLSL